MITVLSLLFLINYKCTIVSKDIKENLFESSVFMFAFLKGVCSGLLSNLVSKSRFSDFLLTFLNCIFERGTQRICEITANV